MEFFFGLVCSVVFRHEFRWLVFSGKIDAARKSLQFVTPGISELAIAEIQVCALCVCVCVCVPLSRVKTSFEVGFFFFFCLPSIETFVNFSLVEGNK